MVVTGTMISNYFKCKRQLHLTIGGLDFSKTSEYMIIGKLIEKESYTRRNKKFKQFNIGIGIVDFINFYEKKIYEMKKSDSYISLAKWQVKYYLYNLPEGWSGIIEVPKKRKKIEVYLSDEDKIELDKAKEYIRNIDNIKLPDVVSPGVINRNICKKCSFKEYCYV